MKIFKTFLKLVLIFFQLILYLSGLNAQNLYEYPGKDVKTIWVSAENPTGEKGSGGITNKGAKGNAYFIVPPGAKQELLNMEGPGIIMRMWMSGTIARNPVQRRAVRIDMYWDGAKKPAVSAPIGDFFGIGLGYLTSFDSELFSSPEGRSFNFTIPMPFRKSAKVEITNESSEYVLIWYDINLLKMDKIGDDALYFHAHWKRNLKTELGKDYEILPKIDGKGRYIGTNIGVIGDSLYNGTWFGEGEVKIYLDGDKELPSLVGTGTEDYIGTGWGQGEFFGRYFGSLLSNKKHDIYAFYRYHTSDPVFFHSDIRVTIQQMGAGVKNKLRQMKRNGASLEPVWVLEVINGIPNFIRLLDLENPPDLFDEDFPTGATGFYRQDDVSSTVYFYLNKPENDLPELPAVEIRLQDLQQKVWNNLN